MTTSTSAAAPTADAAHPPDPAHPTAGGGLDGADAPEDSRPTMSELLELVDQLAARRPVAARVVSMTGDDSVGSKELAATLAADVSLTTRVMKLANSAYFGLGGRVRTVTFAVTVVGFSTIRAMAASAAAGLDTDDVLPADFWPRSKATAVAASELAALFSLPAPDAFCLGLLSGLGQSILVQHDPDAYHALLARPDVLGAGRQALQDAETEVYGLCHTEVSAAALSAWGFPQEFSVALHGLGVPPSLATAWSRCLATSKEAAARVVDPADPPSDVLHLSDGAVTEDRLRAALPRMREALLASDW